MAGLKFDIVINDQGSATLKKVSGNIGELGQQASKTGDIMKGVLLSDVIKSGFKKTIGFVSELITAYDAEEQTISNLNVLLGGHTEGLIKQAEALEKVTRFSHDATLAGQAILGSLIKNKDQIMALTPVLQDFATARLGGDLTAAANLVTKSFAGSAKGLEKYGIHITGAIGSSERLTSIMNALSGSFYGAAAAAGQAGTGPLTVLSNMLNIIKDNIAEKVVPYLNVFARAILDNLPVMINWVEKLGEKIDAMSPYLITIVGLLGLYIGAMQIVAAKTALVSAATWTWNIALNANPIGLWTLAIIGAIAVGVTLGALLSSMVKNGIEPFNAAWENTKSIMLELGKSLVGVGQMLLGIITFDMSQFKDGWKIFKTAANEADELALKAGKNIKDGFVAGFSGLGGEFSNLGGMIKSKIGALTGLVMPEFKMKGVDYGKGTKADLREDPSVAKAEKDKLANAKKFADTMYELNTFHSAATLETIQGQYTAELEALDKYHNDKAESLLISAADETAYMEGMAVLDSVYAQKKIDLIASVAQKEKDAATEKRKLDAAWKANQIDMASAALGNMAQVFQGSKKHAIAYKAMAIGQTIIETYKGATSALAMHPWTPVNFALMASVIALGMANVAKISTQKLAFGGIVKGQGGSFQDNIPFMASRGERVLSNPEIGKLGGYENIDALINSGGRGRTINLNIGGNIIGDEMWVRDSLLPLLGRELARA